MAIKYFNPDSTNRQKPTQYQITAKHPWDVRDIVETFTDLLTTATFGKNVYENMRVLVADEGVVYELVASGEGMLVNKQFLANAEGLSYNPENKKFWKRLTIETINANNDNDEAGALARAKENLVNGALIYVANNVTEDGGTIVKSGFYYCESGKDLKVVGGEVTAEQFAALQNSISKKADKTSVQEISDALNANNTLVTPVLTPNFTAYLDNGDAVSNLEDILVENSNIKDPEVEVGYKLKYSATYKWTSASGKRNPNAVGSDSLFSTLTESGKESDPVQSSDYIESTSSVKKITASITTDEVGYKVSNNYLVPATGTIKTSDTATVTFLYKKYYGTTKAKEITAAVVKALTGVKYINDKSATLSNLTTADGVYYLYAYPERLSKITANGSTVWDKNSAGTGDGTQAFIEKTVTITNAAGKELTYYTYRSTQSGNLANTTLAFS